MKWEERAQTSMAALGGNAKILDVSVVGSVSQSSTRTDVFTPMILQAPTSEAILFATNNIETSRGKGGGGRAPMDVRGW